MIRIIKKGVRLLVHDRTSVGARHPGWLLLAGFLVLPMIITCSSGSKGGTASVALLVKMPRTNQQQASYQNGFWARVWSWVTGVDAAWAQSVVQPPTCTGNCRLLIDVSASDLVPQYTTIQNVAAGYVNVSLSVPAGGGRIFRAPASDRPSGIQPPSCGRPDRSSRCCRWRSGAILCVAPAVTRQSSRLCQQPAATLGPGGGHHHRDCAGFVAGRRV